MELKKEIEKLKELELSKKKPTVCKINAYNEVLRLIQDIEHNEKLQKYQGLNDIERYATIIIDAYNNVMGSRHTLVDVRSRSRQGDLPTLRKMIYYYLYNRFGFYKHLDISNLLNRSHCLITHYRYSAENDLKFNKYEKLKFEKIEIELDKLTKK